MILWFGISMACSQIPGPRFGRRRRIGAATDQGHRAHVGGQFAFGHLFCGNELFLRNLVQRADNAAGRPPQDRIKLHETAE